MRSLGFFFGLSKYTVEQFSVCYPSEEVSVVVHPSSLWKCGGCTEENPAPGYSLEKHAQNTLEKNKTLTIVFHAACPVVLGVEQQHCHWRPRPSMKGETAQAGPWHPSPQQRRSPTTMQLQARLEPSNAAWQGLSILLRTQQARGRASWSASQLSAGGNLRCDDDMHHRASTATTAITQAYYPQPLHYQRQ
jgi:hypothetical protein